MSKRRERERRKQKKISLLFKQKKTTKKTSETHGVGGVLAELLEGVGLGLLGLLVGLGGGDLLDLEERVGERERFLLLLVVEVEREKKNRVREVFLFPRAFFAFLSLPCFIPLLIYSVYFLLCLLSFCQVYISFYLSVSLCFFSHSISGVLRRCSNPSM